MAGEKTQKIIDQVPVIEPYGDNSQGTADIWHGPYGVDAQERIEAGACPEEPDGDKAAPHPPLAASNWPWVVAAYALVAVPLVAAVAGLSVWAGRSMDRFELIALSIPVVLFVGIPAAIATWGWIKQEAPRHKKA